MKMKKILWLLATAVVIIATVTAIAVTLALPASAESYSGTCGENLQWSLDTETGVLDITGTGDMKDYGDYTYVPWYTYRSNIKTINLGKDITCICNLAFYECVNLEKVVFEEGSRLTNIGQYVFYCCTNLTSINLPQSVTNIGAYAFSHCSRLRSISIPSKVTTIGTGAFSSCLNLVTIDVPSSVTKIGYEAFSGCQSLESITLPFIGETKDGKSNTHFGYIFGATQGSLPSLRTVVIRDGVKIDDYAFYKCYSIKKIKIISGVTEIGENAFRNCEGLISIELPPSLKSIEKNSFYGCINLVNIEIPTNVTSIVSSAFMYCTKLESIMVDNNNKVYCSQDGILYNKNKTEFICIPNNIKGNVIIPNGITTINNFSNLSSLEGIKISSSVTSIGAGVFKNCSSLTSIVVDDGNTFYHSSGNCLIETASKTLLAGCKNSIIPTDGSVTSIGDSAFYGCSSLTSIDIPEGVTSIGERAFYSCTSLKSITIPASVTSIDFSALSNCSPDLVIICHENSYAHTYAIDNSINFELVHFFGDDNICDVCGYEIPVIDSIGLSLNKGVTVKINYNIPESWLIANPGAKLVFKNELVTKEVDAISGINMYTFDLTPGAINNALTLELCLADGTVVEVNDVSVAAYTAKVESSFTAGTLNISQAKYDALMNLLSAIDDYASAADSALTGVTETFDGVTESIQLDGNFFTGIGATLGERISVKLSAQNISEEYTLGVMLGDKALVSDQPITNYLNAGGQIVVNGLYPTHFNDTLTVTISNGTGVISTSSMTLNAYLKALYENSNTGEATKQLAAATYRYGLAAEAYITAE